MKKLLNVCVVLIMGLLLILVIWQPVLPSKWFIYGMAQKAKETCGQLKEPVTIRFDLSGKGGGIYNIVADKNDVQMVEGTNTERLDMIMFMKATDFNSMMLQMATGKADDGVDVFTGL